MTSSTTSSRSGTNTLGLLGVAFVVLKLTGYIGWSWWWVLLPFYAGLILIPIFILGAGAIYLVARALLWVIEIPSRRRRKARLAARKLGTLESRR